MIKVHSYATPEATARALIGRILQLLDVAGSDRKLNIALSGGSTPALMFRLWADEFNAKTSWHRLRLFWVDERCVPPTDEQSNYRMTRENLLDRISIPTENVIRIKGENEPGAEAAEYEQTVRTIVPEEGAYPQFDVVLLGAGDDGHTSSIFPGQEALLTSTAAYAVGIHPTSGQQRVALTGQPIIRARHLMLLVTGERKAPVIADILDTHDHGPASYVAHHALHEVELFTDQPIG